MDLTINNPIQTDAPMSGATTTQDWANAPDDQILEADLLIELKLETLPDDNKASFLARMTDVAQKAVIKRVLDGLSEEQKTSLDQVLEHDNPEETVQFLQSNVPNYDDLAREELVRFKRAMLTGQMPA